MEWVGEHFLNKKGYKNPLKIFSERFSQRGDLYTDYYGVGGNFSTDLWFTGPVGIFGGTEISIPKSKGLKFKVEYDPFDYMDFSCCGGGTSPESMILRKKDSNMNFGSPFLHSMKI